MVLASFLLYSCSLAIEQDGFARTLELPDLQLVNATYTLDRGTESPLFLTAAQIEIYDLSNRAVLKDVQFYQEGPDNTIDLMGRAEKVEVDTQSYDATLIGSIRIEKPSEQLVIEAQHLTYIHDLMIFNSVADSPITLIFEGNKRVTGIALVADLASATFTFAQIEEGVLEL